MTTPAEFVAYTVAAQVKQNGQLAEQAQHLVAEELARQVAPTLDRSPAVVFGALCQVPENLLILLHSPQGWTVLCGYLATALDSDLSFIPTVH